MVQLAVHVLSYLKFSPLRLLQLAFFFLVSHATQHLARATQSRRVLKQS